MPVPLYDEWIKKHGPGSSPLSETDWSGLAEALRSAGASGGGGDLTSVLQQVMPYVQGAINRKGYTPLSEKDWAGMGTLRTALAGERNQPGPAGAYARILENFGGTGRHLQNFLARTGPFIASTLTQTPSFEFLRDFGNIDQSMQAYGAGAGKLAEGATQSVRQGQDALGRAGLGRSAASAGLAQQAMQQLGSQQAGLFTNLYQQHVANRAGYARQAFDLESAIAQLAMGMTPQERAKKPSQLGQALGGLGSGLGSLAGLLLAPATGGASALAPLLLSGLGGVGGVGATGPTVGPLGPLQTRG